MQNLAVPTEVDHRLQTLVTSINSATTLLQQQEGQGLSRVQVQQLLLACNGLSRQCNDSLAAIDQINMPPPKPVVTVLSKRFADKKQAYLDSQKRLRESWSEQPASEESNTWSCNLCDFQTFCVNRTTLYDKRQKHIAACHADRRQEVQTLGKRLIPVAASDNPALTKVWTCATCPKGLPPMESHLADKSIRLHLECSQMTRAENSAALKSQGKDRRHRNEAGWHKPCLAQCQASRGPRHGSRPLVLRPRRILLPK